MQILLDQLSALLVAGTVIFLMLGTQLRATEANVQSASAYAARAQSVSFLSWMEKDMSLAGSNFGQHRNRMSAPVADASDPDQTQSFTFFRLDDDGDPDGDGESEKVWVDVRYTLVPDRMLTISDSTDLQLYQVRRDTSARATQIPADPLDLAEPIAAAPTWVESTGRSPALVSYFHVDLLDGRGAETTDPENAEFIRVSMSYIPTYSDELAVAEYHWTMTAGVQPY
ncbi:MAG: hypothetical protein AAF845_01060 [Bacteroidota bacterium]